MVPGKKQGDGAVLAAGSGTVIPIGEFRFSFSRSSGPGGQNVNKLNTKASLRWAVAASPSLPESVRGRFLAKYGSRINKAGELLMTSQRFRDAARNVADCLEKLRVMIASVAVAPLPRRPTRATRSSVEKRLRQKRGRAERKRRRREVADDG